MFVTLIIPIIIAEIAERNHILQDNLKLYHF